MSHIIGSICRLASGPLEQALTRTVERHDDDHRNDHAGANGERHGKRRALAWRDQEFKGETLGKGAGNKPVAAHGKNVGNGEAEPRGGNNLAVDGPILQGNVVDAHPERHAKAHDKGEQQALSFVDRHKGQIPLCVASRRRQQKRAGEMELLGLHLARPCYVRLRLLMWWNQPSTKRMRFVSVGFMKMPSHSRRTADAPASAQRAWIIGHPFHESG